MGGHNQQLGYEIKPSSTTYTPGKPLTFTVAGPKAFKGLLLYVQSSSNPNVRVGNFNVPAGFHSNKDKCDAEGIKSGPAGAITHSSPDLKQPGLQFTWTPGENDACEKVEIHAVVAQDKPIWQILKVINLECAGAAGGGHGHDSPQKPSGDEPVYTPPDDGGNYDGGQLPDDNSYQPKPYDSNGGQQDDNSYQPPPPSDYSNGGQQDDNAYAPAKPKKKCKKKHPHGQEDNHSYAPAPPPKKKCKKHHHHHPHGQEDNHSYAPAPPPKKKCKKHHHHHPHGQEDNHSYAPPPPPKKKCKKHHHHRHHHPHGQEDNHSYAPPPPPKKKCKKKPKFYKHDDTVVDYNETPDTYKGDEADTDYKPKKKKCKKHHHHHHHPHGQEDNHSYAPPPPPKKKKCRKKHHHHHGQEADHSYQPPPPPSYAPPPPPPVESYQGNQDYSGAQPDSQDYSPEKKPCKKGDKGDYDNSQPTYDNPPTGDDSADGDGSSDAN
jgi:hypothetical protein